MTLPRTGAEVLSGHVTLEVRCIDRLMLTFRQPRLQYGQGIHGFFCQHRGNRFVSSTLMLPMTERFATDIRHYIDTRRLDLVRFAKGQSKDQVAKEYLAGKSGGDQILFVGVAQEKTRVWRTARRRDPATGKPYPWLYQEQAMASHWYFYGFDADFGPFHIKFCGYFPYTGQIYLNGHEYAKQQCRKEGIAFTALDNAFGTVSDPAAVQRICDGLTDQKIYRFAGKWLARLPQPFTRADEDADYRWQLPVKQIEFSTTMALDRPVTGRIFSGQLIRDNPGIGRPDKVSIVFGRTIRQRGKFRTPGTFRTQVITNGTCPYLYLFYKKTQVKQYLKEGRALRTETTFNQPRDLGIGKELTNLAALAKAGYAASRRLLDAECISHDPAAGTAALEMLTSPVITTTCTRVPGHTLPRPPRPGAPRGLLRPRAAARRLHQPRPAAPPRPPAGKRSRGYVRRPDQLRPAQAPRPPDHRTHPAQPQLPGHRRRPVHRPVLHPADQTRHHPRTRRHRRCRPAARQPAPPGRPRLQGGNRRPRQPGLTWHPATIRHQAPLTSGTSHNTQPKLTRPVKSLRGKITYALATCTENARSCRCERVAVRARVRGEVPGRRRP